MLRAPRPGDPLDLTRRELKYLLPARRLPALRRLLAATCRLDAHAADGPYEVRSLYLDTADLRLWGANEREAHDRIKVRVRAYPGGDAPVFLEVKRRTGDVVRKRRAVVPASRWPAVLDDELPDDPGLASWLARVQRLGLRPAALVCYHREAWTSEVDDYARVTVDRRVAAAPAAGWALSPALDWTSLDHAGLTGAGEAAVLELKVEDRVPAWMAALVARLELSRTGFSKYGAAVRELAGPPVAGAPVAAWR